jgi:sigma-B regulation protein RsbU (phosphoserine phosphatase)
MLLTTAVGNSAGLALENAMMHLEILEKQRMEQDIQNAWTIQQGLLVKQWPEKQDQFEAYGETRPAKTVGGDFYDFVELDSGRVGLLVGDVSGKGMPAALTMAQLLADFRLSARGDLSPSDVLGALNEDLYERGQRGTFCTMCYLTLELSTGKVICGNAGHHPALCINKQGVHMFGSATGPPAGVVSEGQWRDAELQVVPGDTILLYTDGIIEARENAVREEDGRGPVEFGMERMCQVAHEVHEKGPTTLIARLGEEVQVHCRPGLPHDDCTMIAIRYLGTGN